MTAWPQLPVFTSLPPMTSGMSIFSLAIALSLAFSDARSGEPGAYERIGSLMGGGTRRCPLNATYEDDIASQYRAMPGWWNSDAQVIADEIVGQFVDPAVGDAPSLLEEPEVARDTPR